MNTMTDEDIIEAVTMTLTDDYLGHFRNRMLQAFQVFEVMPLGDQWKALERAMLVYQQFKLYGERVPRSLLKNTPIKKWDELIVEEICNESIEEALK